MNWAQRRPGLSLPGVKAELFDLCAANRAGCFAALCGQKSQPRLELRRYMPGGEVRVITELVPGAMVAVGNMWPSTVESVWPPMM